MLLLGALLGAAGVLGARWWAPGEWEGLQRELNELRQNRGLEALPVAVRSVVPEGRSRGERCVTCHLGAILPEGGAARAPFQAHPPTGCRLPISVLGCTVCHRGDPLRLTRTAAHGLGKASERLLDGRPAGRERRKVLLQAGCAQCHVQRQAGELRYDAEIVPAVAAGMALFLGQGCTSCHAVAGIYRAREAGPALTRVGSRLSALDIRRRLLEPQAQSPISPMPPVLLGAEDLDGLVLFLAAQVGPRGEAGATSALAPISGAAAPSLAAHFPSEYPEVPSPAAGALWARRVGCAGCHRLSESDPGVPDLGQVAWYLGEAELRQTLTEPRRRLPRTWMPPLPMPQVIVESMVAWLSLQRRPLPSSVEGVRRAVCERCHGTKRDPKVAVLSPRPPLLQGRLRGMSRQRFVETVTAGRKGTAMAPWGRMFTKEFISALYDELGVER
jgi:mono/diheme cytochrome c family protein